MNARARAKRERRVLNFMCKQINFDLQLSSTFNRFPFFFLLQSLVVALVASQLAVSGLSMDKSAAPSSSGTQEGFMGKIYRSAAAQGDNEKDNTAMSQANRGARCVRCGANGGGYNGYPNYGYADR